ncbi:Calcium uniporter protein 1 mitochondrial [Bienertia sinuspersici]
MNVAKDRIRLSGLIPLLHAPPPPVAREAESPEGLSASEVRKVLRASQVEMIREKLGEVERDWVAYKEYMEIIEESCGGNKEQALTFAKTLDDCGSVIVLGNSVCLRPHQEIKTLVRPIFSILGNFSLERHEIREPVLISWPIWLLFWSLVSFSVHFLVCFRSFGPVFVLE